MTAMSFVWFWTFWHWSKESFREGSLLRGPLHGIAGHWDEWFRHEASESDRAAIGMTGRTEVMQRRFIGWLLFRWSREADLPGNRPARHFVLGQLASVQPFKQWTAFEKYRTSYGIGGISAIVLTEASSGEPDNVRAVEALVLPADSTGSAVVAEDFQADSIELETPRRAAMSLLRGKGFLVFLALWIAGGRRPYPRWLSIVLALGWLAVGGLIIDLLAGPEPGDQLVLLSTTLLALWSGLVLVAITVTATQSSQAWRQGRRWCARLEQSQMRLHMNCGLTLKGGSAGGQASRMSAARWDQTYSDSATIRRRTAGHQPPRRLTQPAAPGTRGGPAVSWRGATGICRREPGFVRPSLPACCAGSAARGGIHQCASDGAERSCGRRQCRHVAGNTRPAWHYPATSRTNRDGSIFRFARLSLD